MQFPQLPPEYIRPEAHPNHDPEIWYPDWSCFACHDYGKVAYSLVKKVIPDYDADRCREILCRNPDCKAGREMSANSFMAEQLDRRFTPDICTQLHEFEEQCWKEAREKELKRRQKEAEERRRQQAGKETQGGTQEKGKVIPLNIQMNIQKLTNNLAMPGTKPRTEDDNREAEIKKQEAQARLDSARNRALSDLSQLPQVKEESDPLFD